MTIYSRFFLFILFINLLFIHFIGAQVLKCHQNETKFEKFIGIKPSYQQKSTLLYSSKNNTPVTLECLAKCAQETNCTSFLLDYNLSQCYSFADTTISTQNYDYDSRPNVVWFRKTCLNVSSTCKTKAWIADIVAGATLIGNDINKIKDITREECIKRCLNNALCKSTKFTLATKYQNEIMANPVGYCILSDTDRHLTTNSYRVSRNEDEYIENQCINTTHSKDYCAYEEYDDRILDHVDVQIENTTQQQCQALCDESLTFNCRGYSLVPSKNLNKYTCLLHSEDSKLIGPQLLIKSVGAKYYERARCLNVSVTCSNGYMSIVYRPEQKFSGCIYMDGYSTTPPCYSTGRGYNSLQLHIPLTNTDCGISEAQAVQPWNRTLKSGLLIIQYNSQIRTQSDRLIRVGCIYGIDDGNSTEVTVGASVNFTNNYPNHGSTVVNTSTTVPIVTMKIVDYNSKQTTFDAEIGQELQIIIEITPAEPYDIWASNLIATSGNSSIQLLDDNGCPTSLNIFSPFTKIETNNSRILISNFQAFKFPSSSIVRFSVMVHFCTMKCTPINCDNEEVILRTKRQTNITSYEEIIPVNATVYKIDQKKFSNNTEDITEEIPLNIILIVRGANISPDQLVLSENNNKILIAGYDILQNEICLDYDLFVGILVTWVLLQVIIVVCCYLLIRKYKKYFHIEYTRQLDDMHQNFGFGNRDFGRRVHWADQ